MQQTLDKINKLRAEAEKIGKLLVWESVGMPELLEATAIELRVVGPSGVLWRGRKELEDDSDGQ